MTRYLYAAGALTETVWQIDPANMLKVGESADYQGSILALSTDDSYVYCGGSGYFKVRQIDPADMTTVADSVSFGNHIYALTTDDTYVYCTGARGTGHVWQLDPSDMSKVAESAGLTGGIMFALCSDGTYVYVCGDDSPKLVYQLDPTDMSTRAQSDIGYGVTMRTVSVDDTYVYGGGGGLSGTRAVWQYSQATMSKVAQSADYGRRIYGLTTRDIYIYCGGESPFTVWQIDPADMSKLAESAAYGDDIYALTSDSAYVYAGGATTQTVWQIDPADMSKVAESANYGGVVRALTMDIASAAAVYVYALDMGSYEGDVRGEPMAGDRAAWDDRDYGSRHARDIKDGVSIHHLPEGAADGEAPVWATDQYVSTDIATQAELNTHTGDTNNPHAVTHAQLPDVTSDQHHARAHNIDSESDHPDVENSAKADGYVQVWRDATQKHGYEAQSGAGSYGYEATAGYAETIGDGVNTVYTVTHSLNTWDVLVMVWDLADTPVEMVDATVEALSANAVRLTFENIPAVNQYRVLVLAANVGISNTVAVEEVDGVPAVAAVDTIKVPNGTLTDNGDGSVTLGYAATSHPHVEADITDLNHTDVDAIHDNVAGEIATVAEKASPVSADLLLIEDSQADNAKKRVQIGNLPGGGASQISTINVVIDGGGSVITTGIKADLVVDFACTITAATLLADQTGSIVVDIWKDAYANFPPIDADSITSATPPTLVAAVKSQDTALSGWTTAIAAGDVLRFNVDSVATVERVTLALTVERT